MAEGTQDVNEAPLWEQGRHIPAIQRLPVLVSSPTGANTDYESCPYGVVIVSQTCDNVRDAIDRPYCNVSKVVQLDGEALRNASARRAPRYVRAYGLESDMFIDLDCVATISKDLLRSLELGAGCSTDSETRYFGSDVGRKYSRFPFPDDVAEQVNHALKDQIVKKHGSQGALGTLLDRHVYQLRLQAQPSWMTDDFDVEIVIILNKGALPYYDEPPARIKALDSKLRFDNDGVPQASNDQLSKWLLGALEGGQEAEAYFLWLALAAKWAAQCSSVAPVSGTQRQFVGRVEVVPALVEV